ncbi:MAG: hypothetical protein J0L88_12325, partial [Xanthomonadales bacterium]|nr:hypothetical protein [Xanthomonadales bacterium]
MRRPRIWVSQPLFGDLVARLAEHADVHAPEQVTQHAPAAIATGLREADGALVTLNECIGAAEVAGRDVWLIHPWAL